MVKIYAVFSGSYSDRELVAVFSTLEAANQYQQYIDHENEPEEFNLDSAKLPDWWSTEKKSFSCYANVKLLADFGPALETIESVRFSPWQSYCPQDIEGYEMVTFDSGASRLNIKILAANRDEAIHKASEHFNRWLHDNWHIFQI